MTKKTKKQSPTEPITLFKPQDSLKVSAETLLLTARCNIYLFDKPELSSRFKKMSDDCKAEYDQMAMTKTRYERFLFLFELIILCPPLLYGQENFMWVRDEYVSALNRQGLERKIKKDFWKAMAKAKTKVKPMPKEYIYIAQQVFNLMSRGLSKGKAIEIVADNNSGKDIKFADERVIKRILKEIQKRWPHFNLESSYGRIPGKTIS